MGTVIDFLAPLFVLLDGLTVPVKLAWGVWLLWAVGQVVWMLWQRDISRPYQTIPPRHSGVRPAAVRPPSRKIVPPGPATSPYGTSDFIAALDEEQAAAAVGGPDQTTHTVKALVRVIHSAWSPEDATRVVKRRT